MNNRMKGKLLVRPVILALCGVTDAMRIPKDAFYAHQTMWHGWVDTDESQTYIVGQ